MSSWPTPRMIEVRRQKGLTALPAIDAFVRSHKGYSIDEDQDGSHGNTNYVIFGHLDSEAVVFKYFFDPERREREAYGLRHWKETGLVPRIVHDDGEHLLVQSRLLLDPESMDMEIDSGAVGHALGEGIAALYGVPLSDQDKIDFESRFYGGVDLHGYVTGIVAAGHSIHECVPEYASKTFAHSLSFLDSQLSNLLAPPYRLYHQDAGNLLYAGDQLVGFFDLEMCRVGTLPIQIGCVIGIISGLNGWDAFVRGFRTASGQTLGNYELECARAWDHFMVWRYVSHYGDWVGGDHPRVDKEQLLSEAEGYRQEIEEIESEEWPN